MAVSTTLLYTRRTRVFGFSGHVDPGEQRSHAHDIQRISNAVMGPEMRDLGLRLAPARGPGCGTRR